MANNRYQGLSLELKRLVLFCGVGMAIGFGVGFIGFGLALGLAAYVVVVCLEVARFYKWLGGSESHLPDRNHVLIDVAEVFHARRKRHRKTKQRLQLQLKRVAESTAALVDGVLVIDANDRMLWWNPAASEMLSLSESTDKGQVMTNIVRDPRLVRYLSEKEFSRSLELEVGDIPKRVFDLQITAYGKSERLIIIREVTKLHQLEQMRKDFVGNVSHELRTPLTVISGYSETLGLFSESLPPRVSEALAHIETQVDRMNEMVEDLSLLSYLDDSDELVSSETVDLKLLVERVAAAMEPLLGPEHNLVVEAEQPLTVVGNEKELYSAISNIGFNAIKYSPAGGEIRLRLRQKGTNALISVKDEGAGIDPVHIPRLTERFYRADLSRNSAVKGTGLGLAIVKHVMIRHSGELRIQSWPGKGAKFQCLIPLADD